MPASKTYLIDQTRQVTVTANNEVDAIRIANAALNDPAIDGDTVDGIPGVWGYVTGSVEVTELLITKN